VSPAIIPLLKKEALVKLCIIWYNLNTKITRGDIMAFTICPKCNSTYKFPMKTCIKCNFTDDPSEIEHIQLEEKIKNLKQNMILTSAPFVDGYRVRKQLGLVFGETVFKASLGKTIESSIEDFGNSLSFSSVEMSGVVGHMDSAREFAIEKLINRAAEKGANAIIAIDAEATVGGSNIARVTVYGTAVLIEEIGKEDQ